MSRLFVSFSGGETSAYMTHLILNSAASRKYTDIRIVFANTGQENEQTLEFVRDCAEHFGWDVVWVEGVYFPGIRKAPGFRVVNFKTASRDGRPFEDSIAKYGIPNQKFKDCTRNLKLNPLTAYLRSIGWEPGSYDTAIGIRVDEIDRMSSMKQARRIIYPLIEWAEVTKPQINTWWNSQPFRLQLKGYQGNCRWCWKKSFRKHMTLIAEDATAYDFPMRMEQKYGLVGAEFRKDTTDYPLPEGYRRTFFRGNKSTLDLLIMFVDKAGSFVPAQDDAAVFAPFDPALDVAGGCEESCELFADEDAPNE